MALRFRRPGRARRHLEHALGAPRGQQHHPLWVADTDFRAAPAILEAMSARVTHGVFGYSTPPPELRGAIVRRMQQRYGWRIEPSWIVFIPGVVPGLHLAARHLVPPTATRSFRARSITISARRWSSRRAPSARRRWSWSAAGGCSIWMR
jgi:aspartate/methionine/tyrosine aminotransferase